MLRTEVLEPGTLDILKHCMELECLKPFVLVGGTALALQYGHRTSMDLDFFGAVNNLDEPSITQGLNTIAPTRLVNSSMVMLGYFMGNLKVDIVKYRYPLVKPVIEINNIRLASPEDIAAMKLSAITGRGKKKDFTDLYYLLEYFSCEQLFEFYSKKYTDGNQYLVLRSLGYFDDADQDEDPEFLKKNSWKNIKQVIKQRLINYLKTIE